MSRSLRLTLLGIGLVLAGIAAYALGVMLRPAPEVHGTELQNAPTVADVSLTDAAGETVTLGDFDGDLQLLFFGFTRCPDVCPLTMARLADIYRAWGEPEDVRVVMVTVDPQHDTPEVVQEYAAGFHPRFVGLSGSVEQVTNAAKRFYIGVQESGPGMFQHTDAVVVVDADGRFRWVYNNDNLTRLANDLEGIRTRL